jgi:membrane protein YqaA with SNARE-associated domain
VEFLITDYPWLALFILSFLAATVLPLGSEWLLVVLLIDGLNPTGLVSLATAGNTLGACTTYAIGIYGGPWVKTKLLRIEAEQEKKAERFYVRYGSWSLLLSWLPFIGDPICLVGGILRVGFVRFLVLIAIGKLARYATVGWLTIQAAG